MEFMTPDIKLNEQVRLEKDVSARNWTFLTPFLVQAANSLCPKNYIISHFVEASQKDTQPAQGSGKNIRLGGRIDHIIAIKKISLALTPSELEEADFRAIFKKPKRNEWMPLQDCVKDEDEVVQSLLGIEDKRSINQEEWIAHQDSEDRIGNFESREVRLESAQLLKYARLFMQRRLAINDGESYILFQLYKEDLEKLHSALNDTIRADSTTCPGDEARKMFVRMLYEALEEKFGHFQYLGIDGQKQPKYRWERGGEPRGPVSMVRGFSP